MGTVWKWVRSGVRGGKGVQKKEKLDSSHTHQQKLSELPVVKVFLPLRAKVKLNKFWVPVKGDVLVNSGLTENLFHILWNQR